MTTATTIRHALRACFLRHRAVALASALALAWTTTPALAAGWTHWGAATLAERRPGGFDAVSGEARLRAQLHADGVLRLRLAPDGTFDDTSSWAVVQPPAAIGAMPTGPRSPPHASAATASGGGLEAVLAADGAMTVRDAGGHRLIETVRALPPGWRDGRVQLWLRMPDGAHYYGLGDKPGPLDRRGRSFVNWNTDAYAWQAHSDPLYKSIPFVLVLQGGRAHGLLLDAPGRSRFDFGHDTPGVFALGADGDALDLYVIDGPTPADVLRRYTALTGRTPLPPKWALGFQQSRYSYGTEAEVRRIARTLREHRIPADAIYLDIDYQQEHAPFTVDRGKFPHFDGMIRDLRAQGLRTVLITDLHIKRAPGTGYAPYDSGMAQDVFLKRPDGSVYVGEVWPGDSVFPDFTLTRVRRWWGGLYGPFVEAGAAGFWNDMNEPSVFNVPGNTMPDDVLHRIDDGTTVEHRAIHNVYGMQNARATYEGLLALKPDTRPFVLTRAAYAGTQRYAATWTGDNTASWHHLGMSTATLMGLGLSGYAMAGDDVGGFIGSPDPELLTRWFQLGAFNPVFRNHAATDTRPHEAWVDGEAHEARRREAIERRYRLMPYLYTLAEQNARSGLPILRPVIFEYPDAEAFANEGRSFLFGPDLFVAPVVTEAVDAHRVTLPPGTWYGFDDGRRHDAGTPLVFDPRPADAPLFARAGAIVPMQPLVQHTGQTPQGPLELRVYLPGRGADCGGTLYDDDGESFAYRDGAYLRVQFACAVADAAVRVQSRIGHAGFVPWWSDVALTVYGVAERPRAVELDGRDVGGWTHDAATATLRLVLRDARRDWVLTIR